ncbi:hypothetical protein [Amycolatopsis anabasis]|uniref:hypothetical protein n=1 Tax=Amycolatopsis anabasis TaxID=1840409 RepID=UPI00131AD5C9|nr:hypothetical protein [Amycolatopsis anabasis]
MSQDVWRERRLWLASLKPGDSVTGKAVITGKLVEGFYVREASFRGETLIHTNDGPAYVLTKSMRPAEGFSAAPEYCPLHQHYKWCDHNGGALAESGYEAPDGRTALERLADG